jgi:uncharacterized membrane protein YoaK (UPF0700 family)
VTSAAWRRALSADAMLIWLAVGAGSVDAISFFGLGRVFTANMTGNIVLLGLAVGRAAGGELVRSAIALGVFAISVFAASRLAERPEPGRARREGMALVFLIEALAQAGLLAGWLASGAHPGHTLEAGLVALSALAMGAQSGAVLALRIPHVTTTFVTGTLSRLLRDLAASEGWNADRILQASVVLAVFAGAALGGLLLVDARRFAPVLPLAITLAAVARTLYGLERLDADRGGRAAD